MSKKNRSTKFQSGRSCATCHKALIDNYVIDHAENKIECRECAGTAPDWNAECQCCGASPIIPLTGLCGPCTFGEAETLGGNW